MKTAFWGLNAGLVLMIFTSLLPIGLSSSSTPA
jgi:nitric oxide reductase subunit B